jgi:LacI family transcriptional regulator
VTQNGIEMGNMAAKILIERLESEDDESQDDEQQEETYKTVIIESHLIERESTN